MKFHHIAITSALLAAMLATGSTTALAQPGSTPNEIRYEAHIVGASIITTIDTGTFTLTPHNSIDLNDDTGLGVVSLPLTYRIGGRELPFRREVRNDGKTLRLTPGIDQLSTLEAGIQPALHNVASIDENSRAQSNFQQQLAIASAVGSLTGTIAGAALGFLVGCAIGTPVAVFGCLPFGVTGAGIGAVLGTIAVGGPTLIVAGIDLLTTLNAPPGTTRWAE
ncbi:MAG: ammonium transporter [Pseudonocardia sp.]|nr:MAG: ammonium transporter [Pseudonocardia sp.]